MYWRGMVIRWGEHAEQTTRPHFRQWCFRYQKVNSTSHIGHLLTSASGCHLGRLISGILLATRLSKSVLLWLGLGLFSSPDKGLE